MSRLLCILTAFLFLALPLFSQETNNFYDPDRLAEIRLTFKVEDWKSELDSLRLYGNSLLLGKAKIDGKTYENVGVRYRGRKTFQTGSPRNALHIKLNFIDRSQNHQGYKTVKISNALRDPSMVREVLGFEIARKYMVAPQANYAKVYVNDEYYGLFVNIENVSEQFLEKNFNSSNNTFFECNPNSDAKSVDGCKNNTDADLEYEKNAECYFPNYELKSSHGWDDLMKLTKVLDQNPEKIETMLDVDQALWMLAYNNVLVNLSSYSGDHSHNYYLYKDENGTFEPIIWDLNLAFGSYKNIGGGSDLDLKGLQTLDPLLHIDNPSKPLISKLLSNPKNKMIYLSHIRTILNENFRKGQYLERAKELQRVMNVAFIQDKNKFYKSEDFEKSLTSTVGSKSKIPGIGELMEERASYLKKHPQLAVLPVEITELTVDGRPDMGKEIDDFRISLKASRYPKSITIMYRYPGEHVFRSVQMLDDGKSRDGKAGDGMYGTAIKPKNGENEIEYYIVAENKGAISFSPSNYRFNLHKASLTELNR